MVGEYKRATQTVELPSGKKVEMITYFSAWELEEMQKQMAGDFKITGERANQVSAGEISERDAMQGMEFSVDSLTEASRLARKMALKKLVDVDGTEYESTDENIKEFLDENDNAVVQTAINEMTKKK